jgi:uncharacterized protein YprB with RNaseH-like and TPR domain
MEAIPSGVDFNKLTKGEILWLYSHRCKHKHRFTEHPLCFLEEYKDRLSQLERVGFLDIEATNLQGDFGYCLCYSIKELGGGIRHRSVTPEEIRSYKFDKGVMKQFLSDIQDFDRLIGYYSKDYRFDVPFLRTRALRWDLDFPGWKEYLFTDVYDMVKAKLRLHRNRLETACLLLGIPAKQHRLDPEIWQKAQAGCSDSLNWIQKHCDEDVLSLEAVYNRLNKFTGSKKASI